MSRSSKDVTGFLMKTINYDESKSYNSCLIISMLYEIKIKFYIIVVNKIYF